MRVSSSTSSSTIVPWRRAAAGERAAATSSQRPPDLLRGERRVDADAAERVRQRVGDRGGRADRPALGDALQPQRVQRRRASRRTRSRTRGSRPRSAARSRAGRSAGWPSSSWICSSLSTAPRPCTEPPTTWPSASSGLTIRPASSTAISRRTRTWPVDAADLDHRDVGARGEDLVGLELRVARRRPRAGRRPRRRPPSRP